MSLQNAAHSSTLRSRDNVEPSGAMQNSKSIGKGRPRGDSLTVKGHDDDDLPRVASWPGAQASTSSNATFDDASTGNAVRAPVHDRRPDADDVVDSLTSSDFACTGACCYERTNYDLRREIEVRKFAEKPFGVKLQLYRRDLYVVHVTSGSPAWVSGVQLFDKIEAIDSVSIPRNAEPADVQKLLDQPASFCLKVIDSAAICSTHYINPAQSSSSTTTRSISITTSSLLSSVSLLPAALTSSSSSPSSTPCATMLGIVYLNGEIQSVHPRSAAARAHVPVNQSIVGINGRLVYGWADGRILLALAKLLNMGLRIEITTMAPEMARGLLGVSSRLPSVGQQQATGTTGTLTPTPTPTPAQSPPRLHSISAPSNV